MPTPSDRDRRRLLKLAACLAGTSPLACPGPATAASGTPIKLGQSVPLTGPAQHLGIEYQRGLQLAFNAANASGGVGGRPIELISYDDGYEPAIALSNTQDLLIADKVLALVGYVGTESINRCLPDVLKAGVPFIAPLSGAESLRQSPSRWLFNLRPGLQAEAEELAGNLATMGFRRVAVLIQDDADGRDSLAALQQALTTAGLPAPLAVARVERNATAQVERHAADTQAAARALLGVKPAAVVCLAAYATTAAVIRSLHEGGFRGALMASSLSSTAALGPLLGKQAAGMMITQVMPSPFDLSRPVVAAYQQQLRASGSPAPEYVSLEGWIAGQIVVEGLRRMPKGGDRRQLMQSLESLNDWDPGGFALHWDSQRRQVTSQVVLTVLDAQGRPRR